MSIDKDLLDQLMAGRKPGDLFGKDGILQELTKALAERALGAELDAHLSEECADPLAESANQPPNRRNGSFDPLLIAKYQRRFSEFHTKIISRYARGMTTREIQGHIEEIYGIEASPSLISAITDAVMDEVTAWQNLSLIHISEPTRPY